MSDKRPECLTGLLCVMDHIFCDAAVRIQHRFTDRNKAEMRRELRAVSVPDAVSKFSKRFVFHAEPEISEIPEDLLRKIPEFFIRMHQRIFPFRYRTADKEKQQKKA